MKRYSVWNNKGGVGKTFLTFTIATEYALKHEDRLVAVVDMCPQANISEILLGGNSKGFNKLEDILNQGNSRNTIGGYFDKRIQSPHSKIGIEVAYFTKIRECNECLPNNLYLVVGDPSLELQTPTMNQIASQDLPKESWRNVHSWVGDLLEAFETQNQGRKITVFIDCNPSFAIYTEQAILAADRLIVPCTADGSSARAIDNLAKLIYGEEMPSQYLTSSISQKAQDFSMPLPKIHIVPLNRSTQYNKGAAKAFGAMYSEIRHRISKIPVEHLVGEQSERFFNVPDTHSVSIVASHHGMPLRGIKAGPYKVHGIQTQVNKDPLDRYKNAISEIVDIL